MILGQYFLIVSHHNVSKETFNLTSTPVKKFLGSALQLGRLMRNANKVKRESVPDRSLQSLLRTVRIGL
jgi:hypothetical protein